jgi:hypothetical protein
VGQIRNRGAPWCKTRCRGGVFPSPFSRAEKAGCISYFVLRTGLRGEPGGQLPGARRRHWNNRKYGSRKLSFAHANFSANYPQFGHAPPLKHASPVLGRKSLSNVGLKRRQILACPGRPHISGRACLCSSYTILYVWCISNVTLRLRTI